MPRKKTAAKKMTKTSFVKAQPASLSAKEVVEKAKAQGMILTDKYVYTIRSEAKKKSGKTVGRPKGSKNKSASTVGMKSAPTGVEDLLRAAASEIGLSRAIAILQDQQRTVRAVLGG